MAVTEGKTKRGEEEERGERLHVDDSEGVLVHGSLGSGLALGLAPGLGKRVRGRAGGEVGVGAVGVGGSGAVLRRVEGRAHYSDCNDDL